MKISEFIIAGKEVLQKAGLQCTDPLLQMKQIAEFGLGLTTSELYLRWEDEIPASSLERLQAVLQRRLRGEPFQYITGYEWFWESRFQVGPGVLIPRRETELVVETLFAREKRERVRVVELGAGSGNIGLSALHERPRWEWHAFERNPDSLPYLTENRNAILPANVSYFIHPEDFFAKALDLAPYDWVVSNPPYVSSDALPGLAREVQHEPRLALDGGVNGMDVLTRLLSFAGQCLSHSGMFLSEIGSDQIELILQLFSGDVGKSFSEPEILVDYAGLPRVVLAQKI